MAESSTHHFNNRILRKVPAPSPVLDSHSHWDSPQLPRACVPAGACGHDHNWWKLTVAHGWVCDVLKGLGSCFFSFLKKKVGLPIWGNSQLFPIMRMDRRAAITRVWMWKLQSSSSCKFVFHCAVFSLNTSFLVGHCLVVTVSLTPCGFKCRVFKIPPKLSFKYTLIFSIESVILSLWKKKQCLLLWCENQEWPWLKTRISWAAKSGNFQIRKHSTAVRHLTQI